MALLLVAELEAGPFLEGARETNDVLVSARRIYEAGGFALIQEGRHHSFGHDLIGQLWILQL